jgi:hypothetical protein
VHSCAAESALLPMSGLRNNRLASIREADGGMILRCCS